MKLEYIMNNEKNSLICQAENCDCVESCDCNGVCSCLPEVDEQEDEHTCDESCQDDDEDDDCHENDFHELEEDCDHV
jgi:hypothetical protein